MKPDAIEMAAGCHQRPAGVMVIGYGSPIRGDDAVGPLVADRLSDELCLPGVQVISRHVLTAELAPALRDVALVIFLDASTDGPVGQVVERNLKPDADRGSAMAHTVDPRGLLAWTHQLYGRAPRAVLLSTRGSSFDYANYQLTPEVQAAIPEMMARVQHLVRRQLAARPHPCAPP